ncbi:FAST kinase domain-containing protein 2, mitochondrial [Narcine bancroftii]|uniref:FAST kinase domain-containing protein 2, mitochondrial n=1 Tax=Narcine bancroftii TaxID=1343680 RepID=UPI0038317672
MFQDGGGRRTAGDAGQLVRKRGCGVPVDVSWLWTISALIMNAHITASQLVRILRLGSFFSRGCTVTGSRNCSNLIQNNGFELPRRQNNFLHRSSNCLGLTSVHLQFSERMHQISSEAEHVNNCARETADSSVESTLSVSSSTEGTSSQSGELGPEGSSTEWKNMSLAERRASWKQFHSELQQCTSPSDVLDLYEQSIITWKHISYSLMTIWETTKRMSDDQKRYERKLMFEHLVFEKICRQALKEAPLMSCNDLVYSLFAVVKIGVPQQSRLVHTLLRVTQERLNEFDVRAVSVLSSCLRNMAKSKNVTALRAGLRLLVEQHLANINTVMGLQTVMRCIGKESPLPLKKKLESKALSLLNEFTLPNSQYMFITLADMGYRSYPLLEACSNRIIDNIHSIPFWRLVHILQSCKDLQYRNPALLSASGNHVASMLTIWEVKQLSFLLVLFSDLGFRHIELMDGFAQIVLSRSKSMTFKDVLSTLRVFSQLNHRPAEEQVEQFLQILTDLFQSHLTKCSPLELLRGVYYLCLMDHFPRVALSQLFQEDILNELQSSANYNQESNKQMLQYIKLCMELENPSGAPPEVARITDPLPPSITVKMAMKEAMEATLGDSRLYRLGTVLRNIHFIDFEIALDQERKKVVPYPQDDEIGHDPNVQRVAVVCAPGSAFCLGTVHPRERLALKIRHLKVLGYHVLLISEYEFGKLSEAERVEFFKSAIFGE